MENPLSIIDYGGVADWVSNASPGSVEANIAAFNTLVNIATDGQLIVIPKGKWGFRDNLILTSTTKRFNLLVIGDLHFSAGYGMIVEGNRHEINLWGQLYGGNTGRVYSSYTGVGLYLRNAYNCDVRINVIRGFHVGLEAGSLSSPGNIKGSRYNRIWYRRIAFNYSQIDITTKGTRSQSGPSCNLNVFYGGQLGVGNRPATGGNYGIRLIKGEDQGPYNYYTQNYFYHTGFEGVVNGIYAEHAYQNFFIDPRFESNSVINKIHLSMDIASKKPSIKNYFIGIRMSESYFVPGGYGIGTVTLSPMLTSTSTAITDISLASVIQEKLYQPAGDYTSYGYNTITNDTLSLAGFMGSDSERYQWNLKQDDTLRYVPFEPQDQTISTAIETVNPGVDRVYVNYTEGIAFVNLPSPASFTLREIRIENLHAANTVIINGLSVGEDNSIPGLGCATVRSTGASWVVVSKD